jgi:hypothetical protein
MELIQDDHISFNPSPEVDATARESNSAGRLMSGR